MIVIVIKMCGAITGMHFIYYINISIDTKVDSIYLGYIDQQHTAFMSCGESWAQTRDV